MKIGFNEAFGTSPSRGGDYIVEFATTIERLGFDSLWVPEHIVFFDNYRSRYPYNESGELALGSTPGVFDPFTALTAAALATTDLRVGTSILLIGERNPILTAREVASVDQLTGGRFEFGIGVGWSDEEYAALGVPWERRGARCDEYIEVMRELWTTERSSFHGEFCNFDNVAAFPKPSQQPHPPVLVGGNTPPALRRAAAHGDGWYGWNVEAAALATTVATLDSLLAANGRSRDGFALQVGIQHAGPPADLEPYIKAMERVGVERLVIAAPISRRTYAAQLEDYATALAPT